MGKTDAEYMKMAVDLAESAESEDEVPVGAVVVSESGEVIGRGKNQVLKKNDPSAHAEILALQNAAVVIRNYRLINTTLFVTIEPCIMCMGAIVHSRVKKVVFGAKDPKWGGCGSLYNLAADDRLNHKVEVVGGLLETECRGLMQRFFRNKRNK